MASPATSSGAYNDASFPLDKAVPADEKDAAAAHADATSYGFTEEK